jgi:hypothetical protein
VPLSEVGCVSLIQGNVFYTKILHLTNSITTEHIISDFLILVIKLIQVSAVKQKGPRACLKW